MTENEKIEIIKEIHKDNVHRGSKVTYEKIKEKYGLEIKFNLVKEILSKCLICKQYRQRNNPGIKFHDAYELGQKVAIDIMGPIQNNYILVAIDYFSRKGYATAITTKESAKIVAFLENVYKDIGIKMLICDNAKEFQGAKLRKWCQEKDIKVHYTTPYHHQSNGKVERLNRTIREGLSRSEQKGPIRVKLRHVMDIYNSIKHTGTDVSPNDAVNPRYWNDMRKKQYNDRVAIYKKFAKTTNLEKFEKDQEVLVQADIVVDKQEPKYRKGGKISKVLDNDTYEVLFENKMQKRHSSQLRSVLNLVAGML